MRCGSYKGVNYRQDPRWWAILDDDGFPTGQRFSTLLELQNWVDKAGGTNQRSGFFSFWDPEVEE